MPSIELDSVSVTFPVYELRGRSFRKDLLRLRVGGRIRDEESQVTVQALTDVSLSFREGDRIGLVGHNGSGKTTLLRVLSGIYEPTSGSISIDGKVVPILDTSTGGDVDETGYENIMRRGFFLGMTKSQILEKMDEIAEFSGLGNFLYLPMRTYSTGMTMRLAFSVATCQQPEILLMDEIIGTGDAAFYETAQRKLESFIGSSNLSVVATHSEPLLKRFCNKAVLLDQGKVLAFNTVDSILAEYRRVQARG